MEQVGMVEYKVSPVEYRGKFISYLEIGYGLTNKEAHKEYSEWTKNWSPKDFERDVILEAHACVMNKNN